MNDELIPDEGHEVDDFFRDALGNYKEPPSDVAWNKLNRKLNLKEAADFVTFKKPPVSSFYKTPVYRMQWFRAIVAGSVAAAVVAGAFMLIDRINTNNDTQPNNLTHSGAFNPETPFYQYKDGNLLVADQPFNEGYDAQWNEPLNLGPLSSNQSTPPTVFNHNSSPNLIADNAQTNSNTSPNVTNQPDANNERTASNSSNQVSPTNINDARNNNQAVVVDNTDPVVVNVENISDYVNQQDPLNRELDAQEVMALIHAAEVEDSIRQANYERDNPNNNPEVIDGSVNNPDPNQPIDVDIDARPLFPNSFTPNGDGLNEYFAGKNIEQYPDNSLIVQDRNNGLVYERKGYTNDWNASGVPDGIYIYKFEYIDKNNQRQQIVGAVYIFRPK